MHFFGQRPAAPRSEVKAGDAGGATICDDDDGR